MSNCPDAAPNLGQADGPYQPSRANSTPKSGHASSTPKPSRTSSTPRSGRDAKLKSLAACQAGAVSRRQAQDAGFTDSAIRARLAGGRWQRLFPGTYATFSGPVPPATRQWAALLYAGPDAVLSHETAAQLWDLKPLRRPSDHPAGSDPVHLTVPCSRRPKIQDGMVVHLSVRIEQARHPSRLPPRTRVEETLVDLTQTTPSIEQAVGWLASACQRRLTTAKRIREAIERRPRIRWRAALLDALRDVAKGSHSLLEWLYVRKVEIPHQLPNGTKQALSRDRERSRYDDVAYEDWGLVVELDGRVTHGEETRTQDRRRDNATVLGGRAVLRFGWDDVTKRPCEIASEVVAVLRRNGWSGGVRPCSPECPLGKERLVD